MRERCILDHMNHMFFRLFIFSAVFILPVASVLAQTNEAYSVPLEIQSAQQTQLPQSKPMNAPQDETAIMQDTEVTVVEDKYGGDEYVTPNMQNLSRVYWRLGIFNQNDKKAIDNYLIINECDIYRNFYTDDFEWQNVRESTKDMLKEKSPLFADKFKVLVPIDLGRYDMERGGFEIVSNTSFENSRRIQVTGGLSNPVGCDQKDDLPGYPSQVILILNKPFTFNFIKVDEHVAQAFLLRKKYDRTPIPRELRNKGFQRLAFARMRVTFVRFQGIVEEYGGKRQAVLYGKLDGIDVFEDQSEEMLLTSINYQ